MYRNMMFLRAMLQPARQHIQGLDRRGFVRAGQGLDKIGLYQLRCVGSVKSCQACHKNDAGLLKGLQAEFGSCVFQAEVVVVKHAINQFAQPAMAGIIVHPGMPIL